jgi:hypothetical protein
VEQFIGSHLADENEPTILPQPRILHPPFELALTVALKESAAPAVRQILRLIEGTR